MIGTLCSRSLDSYLLLGLLLNCWFYGAGPVYVNAAKSILEPGEEVVMTARQRRVGPGGSVTTPTSVLATTKRVIIINRATLGAERTSRQYHTHR